MHKRHYVTAHEQIKQFLFSFFAAVTSVAKQIAAEDPVEADGGGEVATLSLFIVCLFCALIIFTDLATLAPKLFKTRDFKASNSSPTKRPENMVTRTNNEHDH